MTRSIKALRPALHWAGSRSLEDPSCVGGRLLLGLCEACAGSPFSSVPPSAASAKRLLGATGEVAGASTHATRGGGWIEAAAMGRWRYHWAALHFDSTSHSLSHIECPVHSEFRRKFLRKNGRGKTVGIAILWYKSSIVSVFVFIFLFPYHFRLLPFSFHRFLNFSET